MKTYACILLLLSSLGTPVGGAVHEVIPDGSGDFPSIQSAIDASAEGDTVLLGDGVFAGEGNRDIDFRGKAITVRSAGDDPTGCVIDCEGSEADQHRGFLFQSDENRQALLRGVTVRNGYVNGYVHFPEGSGGGVIVWDASPSIVNCHFLDNYAFGGGAILCYHGAEPAITGCLFEDNMCRSSAGGGIYCYFVSNPRVMDCTFTDNGPSGLYWDSGSSPSVKSCSFSGHTRYGLVSFAGEAEIRDCDIFMNAGPGLSGGGSSPTVLGCRFWGNTASRGAGIYAEEGFTPLILNCIFDGNIAEESGSVSYCADQAVLHFVNCTMVSNTSGSGGVVDCELGQAAFESTVIAFNTGAGVVSGEGSLTCCDVFGNTGGDWVGDIADQYGLDGNISVDPLFCNPDAGNYGLHADSPCAPDYNPDCGLIGALPVGCGSTPTQDISWGAVKALFREEAK